MDIMAGIQKVVDKSDLSRAEMKEVMVQIMEGNATQAQIGAFLTALRMKGETVDEITAAAEVMREKSEKIFPKARPLMDTCGTGGDKSGTINISTAAAFILASSGVKVAKHGNRSITSKSGSADVLEALGVNINIPPNAIEKAIEDKGIGFLFAKHHHMNTMKNVMGPRKELGIRTIFNCLGPLSNPAGAEIQLVGVYSKELVLTIAKVLKELGLSRAMVVHGEDGLDEVTISGKTYAAELINGEIKEFMIDAADYVKTAEIKEIRGGDAGENAVILKNILSGKEYGPKRDVTVLNAGVALYVAGKSETIAAGIKYANELIDNGSALEKLNEYINYTNNVS